MLMVLQFERMSCGGDGTCLLDGIAGQRGGHEWMGT